MNRNVHDIFHLLWDTKNVKDRPQCTESCNWHHTRHKAVVVLTISRYIVYSGIEEKKYTKFWFFTVLDIQDIFYIPGFKKIKFYRILVFVFPFQPEWDPGFRQLSWMGFQFQIFIPNGIPTSDAYPGLSHQFHRDFIGIPFSFSLRNATDYYNLYFIASCKVKFFDS